MIWRYLLYTHVFLAVAGVALQYATIWWLDLYGPHVIYLLLFTFFSTLLAYNIPVFMHRAVIADHDRRIWTEKNHQWIRISTVISLAVALYLFIKLASSALLFLLFPSALFAVFYSIPILQQRSLNRMSYLKTFVVAGVWTLVSFYIPFAVAEKSLSGYNMLGLQRFILMLVLVLPFEVRDIEKDKAMGVVTLATSLGEWNVRYLGLFLLLVEALLSWYVNGLTPLFYIHVSMALLVAIYYLMFRRTWSDAKYMLWGDGILFIPLLLTSILW